MRNDRRLAYSPTRHVNTRRIHLQLVRVEDRILLDAAGLVTGLLPLEDGVSSQLAVDSTTEAQPASELLVSRQTDAAEDSRLEIDGQRLIFRDVSNDRDNQLLVTIGGSALRIEDRGGYTIQTSIQGAVGSGTHSVTLPLASLHDVDRLIIDTQGGHNTITFDLSVATTEFLSQFTIIRPEGPVDGESVGSLALAFVGSGSTELNYEPTSVGQVQKDRVVITQSGQSTLFELNPGTVSDITGMRLARFTAADGNAPTLVVSEGTDAVTRSRPALAVEYVNPRYDAQLVNFFDNQSVILQTRRVDSRIVVEGASNGHGNNNLILDTRPTAEDATGQVFVNGATVVQGNLLIESARLTISAPIHSRGLVNVSSLGDIWFREFGRIQGLAINLVSSNGRITTDVVNAPILVGAEVTLTSAAGLGTRLHPIWTSADRLSLSAEQKGGIYVLEQDDALVTSALAQNGPILITSTGNLRLVNVATTGADGAIALRAGENLAMRGRVETGKGDIQLQAGNHVVLTATSRLQTRSGTITFSPDVDENGRGRVLINGVVTNVEGTTIFHVTDNHSQIVGLVRGGGDIVKQGTGILTIGPAGTLAHEGRTYIEEGILVVDGRIVDSSVVQLLSSSELRGGGIVDAPLFSESRSARIVVTGPLRLGDGSTDGFDFAGTILVQPGQTLTLRDADGAELGRLTQLNGGGTIAAPGGLEVGEAERLTGAGRLQGPVEILAGGTLAPGVPVGRLQFTHLQLAPGAVLELDVRGPLPQQFDQLTVLGQITAAEAILRLNVRSFAVPPGVTFTWIENLGQGAISGQFVDTVGLPLSEGALIPLNQRDATLSYRGGAGRNDLVLSTEGRILFVPQRLGGTAYFTLFIPSQSTYVERAESPQVVMSSSTTENRMTTIKFERVNVRQEEELAQNVRLFFRVFDDGRDLELQQEFELDPELLVDLPSLFDRYAFPDGHYKIYLQEEGTERVRLVLDVHLQEGRVVPENYRELERPLLIDGQRVRITPVPGPDNVPQPADQQLPGDQRTNEDDMRMQPGERPAEGTESASGGGLINPRDERLTKTARLLRKWRNWAGEAQDSAGLDSDMSRRGELE